MLLTFSRPLEFRKLFFSLQKSKSFRRGSLADDEEDEVDQTVRNLKIHPERKTQLKKISKNFIGDGCYF